MFWKGWDLGGRGQENPYEHECNIFWPLIYFLKDVTLPYGVVDFLVAPSMFCQNWLGKTLMTLPWIPPANPHLHLVTKMQFRGKYFICMLCVDVICIACPKP